MTNPAPLTLSGEQSRGVASKKDETIEEVRGWAGTTSHSVAQGQVGTGSASQGHVSAPVSAPLDFAPAENINRSALSVERRGGSISIPPRKLSILNVLRELHGTPRPSHLMFHDGAR